ncbi:MULTISPECIES: TonB-dependent receptor [Pseudoalteromonas]|uniref:TonB-dependent receptor n=1 Tax=Pseudoalteromonas fuliginea TaxID=1872678 RepID=A0ABD3Y9A5_9GAMM|nr:MULTISPECIES: TonB-dependent receptor [Pseudoalteromonas]ALQ10157.1 TonB-dependent receptor [Pseudoalteromonas sp. Bsw20308]KDC50989.1 TonB-dependent receptor [Pseudoalteromonas fuliginea]KDC55567.1 TonB-dependent receptor [Pseudoalteromonas sp. S3431]KJZ28376.1 TonB-dependent receptor [Pseudoalteromonas fuliginea]
MKTQLRKTALSLAIAACVGVSGAAMANETTSAIKGQVMGPNGNPAAGTKVTILHVPSGSVKTTEVNDAGYFTAKGLRVGGPYKVIVDSDVYADQEFNNIILNIGNDYPVNVSLESQSSMEQIVVSGAPISSMSGGTGPASTFTLTDLENTPAINRDLKDIIRIDPRITIDDSRGSINCGGGNPRYNSLTLDGVRMNDNFGLSSNGYPTIRAPFSFDSIEQVSAELAPFDVQYGGFTSCNINAVTKSGGNDVHGAVFYDYTSDSFKGDKIEGDDVDNGNYTEKRYGFNVGLPLIEDKLFLFTSYEKLEGVQQFNYDGLSSGSVTADDISRIQSISQSVYGYDAGGMPSSMPVEDEKILVKLDWNINEDHRANLIYNYNDGNTVSQSDTGSSRVSLSNHFYDQSAEFTSIIASVYSDWSDDFSTEVRIGKSELDATVQSLDAASSFGEMQIRTDDGGTVYIGPDDSRQSNDLDYDTTTFKVAGTYYLDQHTITAGYEFEELDVFNLFVQHTEGEYRFDSINNFEAGLADRIYYNNAAGTNDPNDAAASFSYAQHTFYVQDEYSFTDLDANITFGLRYDKYTSDDAPNLNQNFTDRYGYSNQSTFDGIDLIQPRVGFQWYATDALEVRAGVGLFSGGNPNVWLSNSYSNDGITNIGTLLRDDDNKIDLFNTANVNAGKPGFEVPQQLFDEVGNTVIGSGDSATNAVDPDFEIPSEWKYSLGATYTTENEYVISLDYLYSKKRDAALTRDIALQDSGENTFDGRPIYESIEGRKEEYLLTNVTGDSGDSSVISLAVSKMFDNGVSVNFGYAYTDSDDVNPMTSSTAGSNYGNIALTDPGNPGVASSDYEIPHRFTMTLGYSHEFVDGFATRFNLFGEAYKGLPYSYTFDGSDSKFGDSNWNGNRQLLYVPLENDPNVVYDMSAADINEFNEFIASNGLKRGQTTSRNAENSDWFVKFNFKVTQELPGFMEGHKGEAFFVIDNLTNLLNDDWGVLKKGPFVGASMISTSIDEEGRYVYSDFNKNNANTSVQSDASLWQMRVGVRYTF